MSPSSEDRTLMESGKSVDQTLSQPGNSSRKTYHQVSPPSTPAKQGKDRNFNMYSVLLVGCSVKNVKLLL